MATGVILNGERGRRAIRLWLAHKLVPSGWAVIDRRMVPTAYEQNW